MPQDWERSLERWRVAGLIDDSTAATIRSWETRQPATHSLGWPQITAILIGALTLGAGILLFVAAHWENLSPAARMSLVLLMVGGLHALGAVASPKYPHTSTAFHTLGTVAFGAGIALTGQIFHLAAHWPAAILLWAIGAALGWWFLRQWPQLLFVALLFPAWLVCEWIEYAESFRRVSMYPASYFVTLLSFVYLGALPGTGILRRALVWIGAIALIPSVIMIAAESAHDSLSWNHQLPAWILAIAVLFATAHLLGRRLSQPEFLPIGIAFAWTGVLTLAQANWRSELFSTVWIAGGSIALAYWGVRESRTERINFGFLCFAITVCYYYFSQIMDKLGRSLSLVLIGVLFLGGGFLLERARRKLLRQMEGQQS
jgi:uncharacterized membrane protein